MPDGGEPTHAPPTNGIVKSPFPLDSQETTEAAIIIFGSATRQNEPYMSTARGLRVIEKICMVTRDHQGYDEKEGGIEQVEGYR